MLKLRFQLCLKSLYVDTSLKLLHQCQSHPETYWGSKVLNEFI